MGGPKYILTMDDWMLDVVRRVEKLERRKLQDAYLEPAARAASAPVVVLEVGTVLRDNDDGTLTVVEQAPMVEPEDL